MKYFAGIILITIHLAALAQQQTFDLLSFTPPTGWAKKNPENSVAYSTSDQVRHTWAQIFVIKSTVSNGSIDRDFKSEWQQLVVTPYSIAPHPLALDKQEFKGWNLWSGMGKFLFNGDTAAVLLNTFSDGQRCISFLMLSNTTAYGPLLDEFVASIDIAPPANHPGIKSPPTTVASPATGEFRFNTTTFDDGWTSIAREDWVEARKGNITVLLHYPRKEDSEYISQQVDRTKLFWNLLVAPRYTSGSEFFFYDYNMSSDLAYFAYATLTDQDGRTNFVALFGKRATGWIEVIAPDKQTFIQAFGVDQPDSYFSEWEALVNLSGLNRFGVVENDLQGKWSSDFSSSMQYYSVFTGLYSGYNAYSSRQNFNFGPNRSYEWKLATANSSNGRTAAEVTESSGILSMNGNWQIAFSRIQNKPKTYNAYFSCIKGGRILWLQDVEYGDYTPYGKSSN